MLVKKTKNKIAVPKGKRLYRRGNVVAIFTDRRRKPTKTKKVKRKQPAQFVGKANVFSKENPPPPTPPGKTLLNRIKELLQTKSKDASGKYSTHFDQAALAFIQQMKSGSFNHLKEIIDREEGKTPNRVANADGSNLKTYIGMPLDGDESP